MEKGYKFFTSWLDGLLEQGNILFRFFCIIKSPATYLVVQCSPWWVLYTFFMYSVGYNPVDSNSKEFLAWQTWDLLCIMWYGFQEFATSFTSRHPGFYVSPLRLYGSAIETLFSRLKFISHGNLTSTRYPQVLASLLTQGSICNAPVAGSSDYRDMILYVRYKKTTHQ